jgi:hypothetical protein
MSEYTNLSPSGHFLFDVARSNIAEARAVNLFGYNADVGTDYETIWNFGGLYARPSSAVVMSVSSSDAGDTNKRIRITGLDEFYDEVVEIITTDGTDATTPVAGSQEFLRINQVLSLDDTNAGNISVKNGATTYGYIGASEGISQMVVYTVPADHSLYIFRIDLNSATANANKYLTLRNKTISKEGLLINTARATSATTQSSYNRQVPFRINQCTDFEFDIKSSSGSNEVSIFVEAVVLKNPWGRE